MNRSRTTRSKPTVERVRLIGAEYGRLAVALLSVVITLIGAGWRFSAEIQTQLAKIQTDIAVLATKVEIVEERLGPAPLGEKRVARRGIE